MENASKAIYIVVGVILGVLLLTTMIFVFRQGARVNATYDQKQITNQLELYNARFEQYDRDDNNIIDVISLCNAAFDVNMSSDYDSHNAIEVEIVVGSKTFKIPNKYCGVCNNDSNINFRDRKCISCSNPIFVNVNKILNVSTRDQMSIYDLVNLKLSELDINSGMKKEVEVIPERFDASVNPFPKNTQPEVAVDYNNDTLSMTKLNKNSETVYKYLFARDKDNDFQYNPVSSKVSKVKLTAYCNIDWREE